MNDTLRDRYTATAGTVYLTGTQALVRLLLDQRRLDRARGLGTAGFVSGYEGSPLAGYDLELARQSDLLAEHDLVHRPGLNEELAATAVQGSQLAATRPDARHAGVFGVWYGKAPGLDRATDALRHANLMGTHPMGGALALVGDDPVAKSSTVPSASEHALADLGMPTLYPSDSQDILDLGLHAVEMSRASGLWTAMKLVTNIADGGSTVRVGLDRIRPVRPEVSHDGRPYRHEVTAKLVGGVPVTAEATAFGVRLRVAGEYAARNGLNVLRSAGPADRFGIVAAGKAYLDVCQALRRLGLDDEALARHGIRVLKLGLIYPLEPVITAEFAGGLDEILVVEEKRPFLETALKERLYGTAAPRIVGKHDPSGAPLLRQDAELDVEAVTAALAARLSDVLDLPQARAWQAERAPRQRVTAGRSLPLVSRTPYFCSGCPHNRSTRVPPGTLVGGGIGCHAMVLLMEPEQVGDVLGVTQMGGEGAQWLGMAPFVDTGHLVQNLGDGTFHHSGSLAVRAAVAAEANITFKLLYNSAVAMTGGQRAVGMRSVPELTELLAAEGVRRIIVTTEDLRRYRRVRLARGAAVWHRDRLEEAQRTLAAVPGVTVLIHDQQCAAERRRDRKRAGAAAPQTRIVINERVCEGCGDCGAKSNCLSVQPVQTEYGRKTRIHQSSCNTDYSCLDGDCPSFVTVRPGSRPARGGPGRDRPLEEPAPSVDGTDFTIRITGVGGTGVVTVAQIVAAAAQLDGRYVSTLDQTGLSQKGGAVVSDLKISRTPVDRANKAAEGECDLYLGCDLLVAADQRNLATAHPGRTVAVVSTAQVPTGRMVVDPGMAFPDLSELTARVATAARPQPSVFLDARALTVAEFGDDQCANVVLLGAAYQAGALPLPVTALQEAIKLNGAAVERNLRAFELGRRAAGEGVPAVPEERQGTGAERALLARIAPGVHATAAEDLAALAADRAADLIAYQDVRYAEDYLAEVERTWRAESERAPGAQALTEAVARQLYKLMAYKDEYEVARLCLDPEFAARVTAEFGPGARFSWRLHPPVLRAMGLDRKISLGPWARPALVLLRAARRLRGTRLDLFGLARVRRVERELVAEYRAVLGELRRTLDPDGHDLAVRIAELPDMIRGYEQIKLDNVERYRRRLAELREELVPAAG
ncbi:indolepyruvate ferredoxin oxidoreductase family protein [Acrocarpospora macrocephala]|uniref:Pyruvate ferredoxin/flavodoxin oxidoreductase n=1 Tax=Acrocarpospora macrocephala TaxID=150177 RepID=A0A5M3WKP3_9ACTN|nr:indolepyruvate ferredoxin oxidoreductase family protein [Acrocarpospora macrocephala]GES09464.1 pyruvate ferredoxin/flavodoxin oxidoreductase [Acrocarpospora macrocephala]